MITRAPVGRLKPARCDCVSCDRRTRDGWVSRSCCRCADGGSLGWYRYVRRRCTCCRPPACVVGLEVRVGAAVVVVDFECYATAWIVIGYGICTLDVLPCCSANTRVDDGNRRYSRGSGCCSHGRLERFDFEWEVRANSSACVEADVLACCCCGLDFCVDVVAAARRLAVQAVVQVDSGRRERRSLRHSPRRLGRRWLLDCSCFTF